MASSHQPRVLTAEEEESGELPLILRRFAMSDRARVAVGVTELIVVAVLFAAVWLDHQAAEWIGVPAAIATAAIMAVGVLAGRVTGLVCGLGSALVFLPLVAFDQQVTPLLFGVPIVIIWSACGFLAGYGADRLRDSALQSFATIVEQRDAQEQVAATLRRVLVPGRLPRIPGVVLADLYRPAEQEVGGDFYAVWPIADHSPAFGFAIGDVQGKDVAAAATTALARHTLRATSLTGSHPVDTLRLLNEALHPRPSRRFVSAISAYLCPKPGHVEVTIASGGHPEPIIRRADATVTHLDKVRGTLLGVSDAPELCEHEFRLEVGEVLVCYTDGVTDAPNDEHGERFGAERLDQAIAAASQPTAPSVIAAIEAAIDAFAQGPGQDDIAVLAVSVAESGRLSS